MGAGREVEQSGNANDTRGPGPGAESGFCIGSSVSHCAGESRGDSAMPARQSLLPCAMCLPTLGSYDLRVGFCIMSGL